MSHANSHHQADYGTGQKSLDVYILGTIICVFLTLVPFGVVMKPVFSPATTAGLVVVCAFAQFIVQLICFLRLNYTTEQSRLNVQSFSFILLMVFILIAGSLWVMASLNYNMMH